MLDGPPAVEQKLDIPAPADEELLDAYSRAVPGAGERGSPAVGPPPSLRPGDGPGRAGPGELEAPPERLASPAAAASRT
mgnify:CR=1 FL=1